jgi:cation transport ATPase
LLLLVVSLLAVLIPEEAATLNIRFQVQLVAALTAVASLLAASIIGYIRGGWRSASEDALVFVGALATFSAGFIEWLIWVRGGVSASIAMGALISTTGVAAFTWAGRWLEASLQQRLLRRLEPLRELSGPELRELGPQLWGDGRSENTATRSWAEQAGAEPLGVHPRPETSELLRQTAAIRGDGASPTGRDAIRWATILLLLALPLAVALLMALLYWERNTTASLLLAAATVLALNPRALRRAWVGPVLAAAGRAAGQGVFFRDGAALEATARSHWVVFDALGTLTRGEPLVTAVVGVGSLSEDEILALVAGVEKAAGADSVGDAIIEEAHARGVSPVQVRLARRIPGMGVSATSPRGDLLVGTRQLLLGQGISVAEADQGAAEMETNAETVLFVALAGRIQGVMALRDERRPGAKSVASALNELGVEPVLMTGDSRLTADALGMELGFEHIRAEVAPEQWAAQVTSLRETGHGIAMVVRPPRHEETLAAADVGMTLGGAGLELDAAGVALEGDNPGQAVMTVGIARSAFRASRINLFVASALVIVELGLSSLALSSMSQGHHGWTLPIIVPVIVALASSFSAALLSWEMMSGSRAVRF